LDVNLHARETINDKDILAEYNGVKAYATSHHCQHIGRAGLLASAAREVIMYSCMPNEKPYDIILDKMGNRLATIERYTRHIGNIIDKDLRSDILNAEVNKS
jgi:hypothetical protein